MSRGGFEISRLNVAARDAEPGAVDALLDNYRNYLRLLARTWIDSALAAKAARRERTMTEVERAREVQKSFGQTETKVTKDRRRVPLGGSTALDACLFSICRRLSDRARQP